MKSKKELKELNEIHKEWKHSKKVIETRKLSNLLKIPFWYDGHFFKEWPS